MLSNLQAVLVFGLLAALFWIAAVILIMLVLGQLGLS